MNGWETPIPLMLTPTACTYDRAVQGRSCLHYICSSFRTTITKNFKNIQLKLSAHFLLAFLAVIFPKERIDPRYRASDLYNTSHLHHAYEWGLS